MRVTPRFASIAHVASASVHRECELHPHAHVRAPHCGRADQPIGLDFLRVGTHDYGQYLGTIGELRLWTHALAEGFRRAAFNVFAYNRDDHTKNVAFLMDPEGRWRLAPAFDLTFAFRPDSPWVARHQMGVDGVFADPTREDLKRLGDRWAVPGIRGILGEVADAVARWRDFADEAGVDATRRERIGALILR